jgi:glycosidase/MoaA/NifB/PqqE/SkfB family radical SAM enzyme
VPFVDLRGDLVHWLAPTELERGVDGAFEGAVEVPAGTYVYKFRPSDDDWQLDPDNPRTRAADGLRNSLLVVGGSDEPVLHAPAAPWLALEGDGRLVVRAGLRRGAGTALGLRWDEGGGRREQAMALVAEEDEHLLFERRLPGAGAALEYLFVLPDGRPLGAAGGAGQAFRAPLAPLQRTVPAWWREAVLYTVFVDRFRRAGGRWPRALAEDGDRRPAGGDLDGVTEALPYLADLGVTVLHLTPLVVGRSAHRYDGVEPRTVDPALGGEPALARLLAGARARGLRVLFDVPVTHVHRDFFAFRDVRARGLASPYFRWFRVRRFPFAEGPAPGYDHYQNRQWEEPLLDLAHEPAADFVVGTFARWAALGGDGFRLDAAADAPPALIRRIVATVRAANPDAVVFGEVVPDNGWRFVHQGGLDAATDFVAQQALHDWLWRRPGETRRAVAAWQRRRFGRGGPGWTAIEFTATHDQHRLLTHCRDPRAARLAHLLLFVRPAVPALYYGDERELLAPTATRRFEDAWPDRQPLPWPESADDAAAPAAAETPTAALVRALSRLRRTCRALREGDEEYPPVVPLDGAGGGGEATGAGDPPDDVLALRRRAGDEVVDALLHAGEGWRTVALPPGAPSGAEVRFRLGDAELADGAVRLGPYAGVVLTRAPAPAAAALWAELRENAAALAAAAFREGLTEAVAPPAHLYVTVTERCNLRCRHCLTHAPERTRAGTARTLPAWLLDRLREPLAAARYVGFSHGGESLVAPVFWDVLATLRTARAGRPTDVHLLSNGLRLDGDTVRRLAEAGVTSLAVSLDGASPETNDAMRQGGSFERVCAHLRALVAWRAARGVDLRVGVSAVVGAWNVAELPALGALVRDLGLDWLKIEELFPATPAAAQELLPPGDPRLRDGLAALREGLRGTPVVLVDHLDAPEGCPCEARDDPALAAFLAADGYANRAAFHPCRMPWEQACVDPDGTVHPVDYDGPALGSLLDAPLLDLWDGPAARGARAAALRRVPGARRRACRE